MDNAPSTDPKFQIIVNGRQKTVDQATLTFRELLKLAFDPVPPGENFLFTVTYRNGPPQNPHGIMSEGDTVYISNGMLFNVTATDKS